MALDQSVPVEQNPAGGPKASEAHKKHKDVSAKLARQHEKASAAPPAGPSNPVVDGEVKAVKPKK